MALKVIAGWLKGRKLKSLKKIRPTKAILKEAIFNIIEDKIKEATFLDLFAGSGAVGIEALSRGAKSVTFIDNDKEAIKIIYENLKNLNLKGTVIYSDVFVALQKRKLEVFDIVYIDPPYAKYSQSFLKELLEALKKAKVLKDGSYILIEEPFQLKKEEVETENFSLKRTKKFGKTLLKIFEFKSF